MLIKLYNKIFPPKSVQFKVFSLARRSFHELSRNGINSFLRKADLKIKSSIWRIKKRNLKFQERSSGNYLYIQPISTPAKLELYDCRIDIIVCVHNAFEDVVQCLESIDKHTRHPYHVIIVDDGSDNLTKDYLVNFANGKSYCELIQNEKASGYTYAANKGLRSSNGEFVVLINSDTIVGIDWLERLYSALNSNENYGVTGPLSNCASWQSIPELENNGDWAVNPLPDSINAEQMSQYIAEYSGMLRPEVKLLNGFCMMIKRAVINDIGYFDEEHFGEGYGEEDDFNLRARNAGWKLVLADDVYIYHSQSKSYSNERRKRLCERAIDELRKKHGNEIILDSVDYMHPNRVIEGIRSRSKILPDQIKVLKQGCEEFADKKVLFVLPIIDSGGGGNVVIDEVRCMRKMGVEAVLFNLTEYRDGFLRNYPQLDIPVIFGNINSLVSLSFSFDAIIATANYSVVWLKLIQKKNMNVILGYYVQDFEVLMYDRGSKEAQSALDSYSLIEFMRLFAKTSWVCNTVRIHTQKSSEEVGISVNIDVFRPRLARQFGSKPVVIVAMIRPGSTYRNPVFTMDILRRIEHHFKFRVDIRLFGTDDVQDPSLNLSTNFNWTQTGKLTQHQVANLLSDADIFVDFSSHQAMGLTALEAMACGCAVIVPQNGGAIEFVINGETGIVVDTNNPQECYLGLKGLIEDDVFRKSIQTKSIREVSNYFPERVAFNILRVLFG